jgi:hypothetical protein
MEGSQKIKNKNTIQKSYYRVCTQKELKSLCWRDVYTAMFVQPYLQQSRYGIILSVYQQMNELLKMWYVYTMEYYSVIEKLFTGYPYTNN